MYSDRAKTQVTEWVTLPPTGG